VPHCKTRAIWSKLHCLLPNLQLAIMGAPSERRLKPMSRHAQTSIGGQGNLHDAKRRPTRTDKGMSG
jgi:hypothetical protein